MRERHAGAKRCYLPGTSFTATGASSNVIWSWLEVPRLVRDDGPILAVGLASIELRRGHSGMPVCETGGSWGADTRGASSSDLRHRCVGLSNSLTDIASPSAEERTGRLSSSSGLLPNSSHRGQASRLAEQRRCRYGIGGYEGEVCEKRFWWNTSNWHERFCKRAACAAASLSMQ